MVLNGIKQSYERHVAHERDHGLLAPCFLKQYKKEPKFILSKFIIRENLLKKNTWRANRLKEGVCSGITSQPPKKAG